LGEAIIDILFDHPVSCRGKSPLHRDPCKLIMLDAFDLGVLGELGASRFLGSKWVRAKDAKDAKG
jgi:hypothetical protein